jgi:putative spermidine/putrescine transport system ATP-binding protein
MPAASCSSTRPRCCTRRPANAFVARFVGFENLVPMTVSARDGETVTATTQDGSQLKLSQERFGAIPDAFVLAARADGLSVSTDAKAEGIPATLGLRTYLGRAYQYQSETAAGQLIANGSLSAPLEPGAQAKLVPVPDQCCVLQPE